jgi:hypothetical protein
MLPTDCRGRIGSRSLAETRCQWRPLLSTCTTKWLKQCQSRQMAVPQMPYGSHPCPLYHRPLDCRRLWGSRVVLANGKDTNGKKILGGRLRVGASQITHGQVNPELSTPPGFHVFRSYTYKHAQKISNSYVKKVPHAHNRVPQHRGTQSSSLPLS